MSSNKASAGNLASSKKSKPTGASSGGPEKAIAKRPTKRVVSAQKGEKIHYERLVVGKDEQVEIRYGGGELQITEIVVEKTGTLVQNMAGAPSGFVIGKLSGAGKAVMKF